jgi:hypothetical protein
MRDGSRIETTHRCTNTPAVRRATMLNGYAVVRCGCGDTVFVDPTGLTRDADGIWRRAKELAGQAPLKGKSDPALEQLRVGVQHAWMQAMSDWRLDPDEMPIAASPPEIAGWPSHPALGALLEMRSRPELAPDCAMTIVELLFPSHDPMVPSEVPAEWWTTPLGREIRDVLGGEDLPRGEMSATDAAAILEVPLRTIQRWIKAGRFPGARREDVPGGYRWLVPTTDIEQVAEEQRRTSTSSKLGRT